MSLTLQEKERIRYFLGYPNTTPAASLQLGIVRNAEFHFLVDLAMENLRPEAEDPVRRILSTMEAIECVLAGDAVERLAVVRAGNLALNQKEPEQLEAELRRWGLRLADTLGCPVYPYSERYAGSPAGHVGSIRRRR